MEEAAKQTATTNGGHAAKTSRKELKSRALTELAPNGNLSCLLTTADPDMATRTHFLYETGGNIGKGHVRPNAHTPRPRRKLHDSRRVDVVVKLTFRTTKTKVR